MAEDFMPGTVWLVGAGPGDPELLTRKAERLLAAADIVFYDALVGEGILALAPQAALVSVGKRSGRHSKDQSAIDDLIVAAALAGRRVLRLKGGGPFGLRALGRRACRLRRWWHRRAHLPRHHGSERGGGERACLTDAAGRGEAAHIPYSPCARRGAAVARLGRPRKRPGARSRSTWAGPQLRRSRAS